MTTSHRWILYNPVTDTTIQWEMNPADGALPELEKNITTETSTQGGYVIWQGPDKPVTMPFTGSILTESHYEFFRTWYKLEHQVTITDDLGQQFEVFLLRFKPKRSLSSSHPWKATYECGVLVVG